MDVYTATELAYKNGYKNGYEAAKNEIVHCKDCKHYFNGVCAVCGNAVSGMQELIEVSKDHYCSYGEKKQNT